MDQNLEPNYRPRHYCTCPKVARLSDIQVIQDVQARYLEQMDNASLHDSQDRPPKPSRRPFYHSDWSDFNNDKDSQAWAPPTRQDPQHTTSCTRTDTPLRRPNTYPKVLTFGRGNMAPLANGLTIGHRHGCGHGININHPPQPGAPKIAMVSPDRIVTTDRVQTYDEMSAPVRARHALANWTSVSLGNNPNRLTVNERETEQFYSMTDTTGPQNRESG